MSLTTNRLILLLIALLNNGSCEENLGRLVGQPLNNQDQSQASHKHRHDHGHPVKPDKIPLIAQPLFQEVPDPSYAHSTASYWSKPNIFESSCQETTKDFYVARDHLSHVKDALLDGIDCGGSGSNCTKILILSTDESALRHPPRFGLYNLETISEGYPAYTRKASKQSLFYKEEYDKWIYAHKMERWVVGPTIADASGGVVMMSEEKCPWKIDFGDIDMYYYDRLVENTWNPIGNGWRLTEAISIECYNEDKYPLFSCRGCRMVNITSDGGRISEYHPNKLGIYHVVPHTEKIGFLGPVFKKDGQPSQYLYSHHPLGRLWLLGQSYTTWSIRLNLITGFQEDEEDEFVDEEDYDGATRYGSESFCPTNRPPEGAVWEYLQSRSGEEEIWLKDDVFKITCIA